MRVKGKKDNGWKVIVQENGGNWIISAVFRYRVEAEEYFSKISPEVNAYMKRGSQVVKVHSATDPNPLCNIPGFNLDWKNENDVNEVS